MININEKTSALALFNPIIERIKTHQILFLLLVNTLFFIALAFLLPIRFEENDDVIMLLFSSGGYSGLPDAHLVFINYIYGCFLTFLYSNFPDFEWYTLLFAIIHILSLSIIIWSLFKSKKNSLYKILFVLLFYLIEVQFILLFQFTTTAAMAALAGIILIDSNKSYQRLLGVLLFIVAGLIRFDAAMLLFVIISPLFIKYFLVNNKFLFSKHLFYMASALFLLFAFVFIDSQIYKQDKNWKYYKEYNKLRGQINDNPNAEEIKNNLPKNISLYNYKLLLAFFQDPNIIDLDQVTVLNKQIKKVDIQTKISNIYPSLSTYNNLFLFIFIITGIIFSTSKLSKNKAILLISLSLFVLTLCFISMEGTPKKRVVFSSLIPLIYLLFNSLEEICHTQLNKVFKLLIGCAVILFLVENYKTWNKDNKFRTTEFIQQEKLINDYFKKNTNSLVPFGAALSVEFYPPFSITKTFKEKKIYYCGWLARIPFNFVQFDSYFDLVNRHAIFIRKNVDNWALPYLQTSILEKYNISTQVELVGESKNYMIVKFNATN